MKNSISVNEYIKRYEDFLLRHWSEKLNAIPYDEITRKDQKWRWQCSKCGDTSVYQTVSAAKRHECVCESCYELEQKRKQAQILAHREVNISKNRSFGQTAIAFCLSRLECVSVAEEVLLDTHRRFKVDIVVKNTVSGEKYAIEHDSNKYHSSSERKASDKEKDELMRASFDRVVHIRQGKVMEKEDKYFYTEGSLLGLEDVIRRLIYDLFGIEADVDLKRDTMRILRAKNYRSEGRSEWNMHILDRLSEDWDARDNAGYELSDFSPGVYYNALWRCKNCGYSFYASISNRVRGDVCVKCKDRRKKVLPCESFAAIYPEKAKNWSSENELLPTEVSPASAYNAKWVCAVCGHRWQTEVSVVSHGKYGGCCACGRVRAKKAKYKAVEKIDPSSGAVVSVYDAIMFAKQDGYPKVDRALKSQKEYKGFLWRFKGT